MYRILKNVGVLAITCFFAFMWGLRLRENLIEQSTPSLQPNYDRLLATEEDERSELWGIYLTDQVSVGTVRATFRRQYDGSITTQVVTTLRRSLAELLGFDKGVDLIYHSEYSPLIGLSSFSVFCDAAELQLLGRIEKGEIRLSGWLAQERIEEVLPYDAGDVTGTVLTPTFATPTLQKQLGQRWAVRVVDPLTGGVRRIDITVVQKTQATLDEEGPPETIYKLNYVMGRSSWYAWVRENGQAIVQGAPLPVVLRREDLPQEVIRNLKVGAEPADR